MNTPPPLIISRCPANPIRRIAGAAFLLLAFLTSGPRISAEDASPNLPDLSLVGTAQIDGISYASVVNNQTQKHLLLSTSGPDSNPRLTGLTESGDAIIEQDGQSILLRLGFEGGLPTDEGSAQSAVVANFDAPPKPTAPQVPTPPAGESLPLVFRALDPAKVQLTDAQQAIIDRLRQNFLNAIGSSGNSISSFGDSSSATNDTAPISAAGQSATGQPSKETEGGQNPVNAVDPNAAERQAWQSAQAQSDAELVMLFGTEAFNLYEMGLAPLPQVPPGHSS